MRAIGLAYVYALAFFLLLATAPTAGKSWYGPGCPSGVKYYHHNLHGFPKENPKRCYILFHNNSVGYNRTGAFHWCKHLHPFAYPAVPKTKEHISNIKSIIPDKSTYWTGVFVTEDGTVVNFQGAPITVDLGIAPKPSTGLIFTRKGASYSTTKDPYLVCQINVFPPTTTVVTTEAATEVTTEVTTEAETENATDATPAAVTDPPPSDATAAEGVDGDAMTTRFSVMLFFLMAFVLA